MLKQTLEEFLQSQPCIDLHRGALSASSAMGVRDHVRECHHIVTARLGALR